MQYGRGRKLTNVDGKLELEQKDMANLCEIETANFQSGIYIIYFYDDYSNQILSPLKLIKLGELKFNYF